MTPAETIAVLRLIGGAFYVGLGIAVWRASPKNASNVGFAVFATGSGAWGPFLAIAYWTGASELLMNMVGTLLFLGAAIGLGLLAWAFPERPARAIARLGVPAVAVGVVVTVSWSLWWSLYARAVGWSGLDLVSYAEAVLQGTIWGVLAWFALRAARTPRDVASLALVSLAIAVPASVRVGGLLAPWTPAFPAEHLCLVAIGAATLGTNALLWLRALARGDSWWASAPAWGTLGAALFAQLSEMPYLLGWRTNAVWDFAVGSASRAIAAVTLAIALVRGQVRGLDRGLRWGVSRGTIAAIFIAVFFVASEGAQILFGQGNEWFGLLAAGVLVFAIAPLQRAAERLAEKAVPVTTGSAAATADHLTAYRLAVEAALRNDGRLTAREETHLADLAQALGVGAGDALRLRREVERTAAADRRDAG